MRPVRTILRDYKSRARTRNRSFAQSGEDRISSLLLASMRITSPTYLDLGANHPTRFSNTYLFYLQGCRGVCVEADPRLARLIKLRRFRDTCLNVAVAPRDGTVTFHRMGIGTLSTTSNEARSSLEEMGHRVERTFEVEALSPMTILARHFTSTPNLVSLDVEGLDLEILRAWDFSRHRPEVFIVETLDYAEDGSERKLTEVAGLLESVGYFAYGDTHINTIFVDREAYVRGRRGDA